MAADRRGRRMMWCSRCDVWFPIDPERFVNVCPRCGRFLSEWRCYRCGHVWTPRNTSRPAEVCPRCRSRYWNRPYTLRRGRE